MLSEPLHLHELRTPDLKPKKKRKLTTVGQINDRYLAGGQQGVHLFLAAGFAGTAAVATLKHVCAPGFSFALNEKFGSFLLQRSVSSEERNFFLSSRRLSFGVHFNKFFFSLFRGYFPRFLCIFLFHSSYLGVLNVYYYYYCWYLFRSPS